MSVENCVSNAAVHLTNHEIRSVLIKYTEEDVDIIHLRFPKGRAEREKEKERGREEERKPGVFVQIHANS